MAFKSFLVITIGMFAFSLNAQQTTNQALQDCMNKVTARSAATGALIGGLLGAVLGGDGNKNKSAALGAGLGAAAGGLSGWQSSFKTCVDRVNVVTSRNAQSKDYQQTVEKYGYKGDGTLFKLEASKKTAFWPCWPMGAIRWASWLSVSIPLALKSLPPTTQKPRRKP